MVNEGSQFIIATHSPILLGLPNAQIYNFTMDGVKETEYEKTDSYVITKSFLNKREMFLKELFDEI
jgi:predicted ATPase